MVNQKMQNWQAQQQKIKKMHATKTAQLARIGLVENNYQRVAEQVAALQVRSFASGVVQQVFMILGEQMQVGGSVALVANQQALFAELQVQARDINLGQQVIIDTRTSKIIGEVIRIDTAL